jgi:hypothetical protein
MEAAGASAKLSCPLHEGTVPPVWQTMQPDRGVRERAYAAQVATRLRGRRRSLCCGCSEIEAGRTGSTSLRCRQRRCAGEARLRAVEAFSQLKLSENQAKAISLTRPRTLRVKTSLTLAKSRKDWRSMQRRSLSEDGRDLRLRIHRSLQTCMNIED